MPYIKVITSVIIIIIIVIIIIIIIIAISRHKIWPTKKPKKFLSTDALQHSLSWEVAVGIHIPSIGTTEQLQHCTPWKHG